MMITSEMRDFFSKQVLDNFERYVKVYTTSDESTGKTPSTERQFDLAHMLENELKELGLEDVVCDEHAYVYGTLPAQEGVDCPAFGLLAHMDTSPDQPGENVKPRRLENWDGSTITFPDDPDLTLSISDCAELEEFIGDTIITASGKTLLGADDKGGVAEIMAAMATFKKFPELKHGEIRVCFNPDEEIGAGMAEVNLDKLPHFCYTMDGGYPGELEGECFDAWGADVKFKGVGVHPGYAKNKMVNAVAIASRFVAALPEWQTPERTEKREGFFHVVNVQGDFENASCKMIIRDFEEELNKERIEFLESLKATFEKKYPGLVITIETKHQYQNMRDIIQQFPNVMELADKAIRDTGLEVVRKQIRGGTDGSRLTQLGHPTPNIFEGGMLFHSRKEWIAESSLFKGVETILYLAKHWSDVKE